VRKTWSQKEIETLEPLLSPLELDLFHFLLETGARLSSVILLDWGEVDIESGVATFRTRKGARALEKLYQVPLSLKAQVIIQEPIKKKRVKYLISHAERFSKQINRKSKRLG
jgi:integrase